MGAFWVPWRDAERRQSFPYPSRQRRRVFPRPSQRVTRHVIHHPHPRVRPTVRPHVNLSQRRSSDVQRRLAHVSPLCSRECESSSVIDVVPKHIHEDDAASSRRRVSRDAFDDIDDARAFSLAHVHHRRERARGERHAERMIEWLMTLKRHPVGTRGRGDVQDVKDYSSSSSSLVMPRTTKASSSSSSSSVSSSVLGSKAWRMETPSSSTKSSDS